MKNVQSQSQINMRQYFIYQFYITKLFQKELAMNPAMLIAFKILSFKYFKRGDQCIPKKVGRYLHPASKNPIGNLNSSFKFIHQNSHKMPVNQQIKVDNPNCLNSLKFKQNFQLFGFKNSKEKKCLMAKQQKQKITHETKSIETIQFQANKPIEDKLVHQRLTVIEAQCMSIFDGHGGNTLSSFASKKVRPLIDEYLLSHLSFDHQSSQSMLQTIKNAILHAYRQIQQSFYEIFDYQLKMGNKQIIKVGTCAITVIVWNNHIVLGNCGDSQAAVITHDQITGLASFKLNDQLNTSNYQELQRIQKDFQGVDDHVLVSSKLNSKVYIKGLLQPTHTLGDYYLKKEEHFKKIAKLTKNCFKGQYIKNTPQLKDFVIKPNFKYLIVASDGLWDFTTEKSMLKVMRDFQASKLKKDLKQLYLGSEQSKKLSSVLCDHVLENCSKRKNMTIQQLKRVSSGIRRQYCDDISLIVMSFRHGKDL